MGHILDRKRFGAALFEEVVRQSGIVRVITSLNGVQRNGWVWMLSTDGWYLATSFIIDASGLRSVVGRGEAGVRRIVRLVAAYAVLEQNDMGKCLALLSDIDDSRP
jgi:flavin-dependent dehydrogenase